MFYKEIVETIKLDDVAVATSGTGSWSSTKKLVPITKVAFVTWVEDPNPDYAQVRVYFRKRDWDVTKLGLIYTDPGFLRGMRELIKQLGFAGTLEYTEQGMQGDNYVSMGLAIRKFVKTRKTNRRRS